MGYSSNEALGSASRNVACYITISLLKVLIDYPWSLHLTQVSNEADLGQAYRYLANYHFKHGHHNDAVIAINKCLDFPEIREEAKALCLQLTLLSGSAPSTSECQAPEKLAISLGNNKGKVTALFPVRPASIYHSTTQLYLDV